MRIWALGMQTTLGALLLTCQLGDDLQLSTVDPNHHPSQHTSSGPDLDVR